MKNKRQYRELSNETKLKISQSLKYRNKSEAHKQAIAKAMKLYWETIPHNPKDEKEVEDE